MPAGITCNLMHLQHLLYIHQSDRIIGPRWFPPAAIGWNHNRSLVSPGDWFPWTPASATWSSRFPSPRAARGGGTPCSGPRASVCPEAAARIATATRSRGRGLTTSSAAWRRRRGAWGWAAGREDNKWRHVVHKSWRHQWRLLLLFRKKGIWAGIWSTWSCCWWQTRPRWAHPSSWVYREGRCHDVMTSVWLSVCVVVRLHVSAASCPLVTLGGKSLHLDGCGDAVRYKLYISVL